MSRFVRAFLSAGGASLLVLGGAVTVLPPPPPLELVSDAPVCRRVLPSGDVLEGPDVCLPLPPAASKEDADAEPERPAPG